LLVCVEPENRTCPGSEISPPIDFGFRVLNALKLLKR
jgi:hypothetical protein